ncbi:MAG: hypothetical protein SGJ05_09825 [bacterium]|nr:hypothetical protein [bacterium]
MCYAKKKRHPHEENGVGYVSVLVSLLAYPLPFSITCIAIQMVCIVWRMNGWLWVRSVVI